MADKRTSDTPTAVHSVSTSQLPVYKQTALEFAEKLGEIPEAHAAALAAILREYAGIFQGWETDPESRPTPTGRRQLIDAYLVHYRRAVTLCGR